VTETGRPRRRWVQWALGIGTFGLLLIAARGVDWPRTWSAVASADPSLVIVATTANLASLLVKAVRWSIFLRATGVRSVSLAIRATFSGAAFNSLLVANGGDAVRVAAVARAANVSSATVLATAAIDRLCDLATYVMMFVAAAIGLPLPEELARWRYPGAIVATLLIGFGAALIWWNDRRAKNANTRLAREPTILSAGRAYWRRLTATSAMIVTPGRIAFGLALSLAAWAGQWATFHYAAHAASLSTTAGVSLLALIVVNASFLVRLTPGNIGVVQLLYAVAATASGLDRDHAVAVAFLISTIQYIPVIVVGLLVSPALLKGRPRDHAMTHAPKSTKSLIG